MYTSYNIAAAGAAYIINISGFCNVGIGFTGSILVSPERQLAPSVLAKVAAWANGNYLTEENMDISPRGIDLIVSFEGKKTRLPDGRYQAYLDTLAKPPVPTIYCGLTKNVKMGMVISEEDGERMFAKELGVYEDAVERCVKVPLNQNQFDALVSFVYNCGPGALAKSTLLKELNKGNYGAVPNQLMRWTKAGGKTWKGLVRRRQAEGSLFMEPMACELPIAEQPITNHDTTIPDDHMPQQVSEHPGDVKQALKTSWTIRSALAGVAGGAVQAWEWAFSTAKEAGTEIVAINAAKGPFDALLSAMKANMTGIAAAVVIVGCSVAIFRRLYAAREGKVG